MTHEFTSLFDAETAQHIFRFVDLVGVFCNGIIGGRIARAMRFDAVGFAILAIVSALGGGMIRDTLLNTVPIALTDPFYLATALAGAAVAFLWKLDSRWSGRAILVADALVLGCWSATGASKALTLGFGFMPALMLGMVTAIGGSMIRDVAIGSIPRVFGGNPLYATPSALATLIQIGAQHVGLPSVGMGLAIIAGLVFVLLAHRRRWQLPPAPERTVTLTPAQLKRLMRLRNMRIRRSPGHGFVVSLNESGDMWAAIPGQDDRGECREATGDSDESR
ncbi:trimeric intracellular cation channel family protein [Nanchangia anserum]|uniref:trimeric intracellular cation channel family protein n=1 Tax=Nanchangia anserum TaxID=2692125 RepID=UPI0030B8124A